MDELKRCPFCGRKVKIEYYEVNEPFTFTDCGFEVGCRHCGIRFREHTGSLPETNKEAAEAAKQKLITMWNTRK